MLYLSVSFAHSYSLRSLLYLSYSLRPTSLMAYWLIVTVLLPIASFTTTRALSGSMPSICSTWMKHERSQRNHYVEMRSSCAILFFCFRKSVLYCIKSVSARHFRSTVPCHTGLYVPLTLPAHNPQAPSQVPPPSLAPRLAWGGAYVLWAPGPLLLNDLRQDPNLLDAAGVRLASHLCSRQRTSAFK